MSSVATPEIHLDKNHFVKQMLVKMLQPVVQTNKVVYIYNKKYLLLLVIAEMKALQFLFTFFWMGVGGFHNPPKPLHKELCFYWDWLGVITCVCV